ncbi:phage tail terminator protein
MIAAIVNRLLESGTPFRIAGGAGSLAAIKDRPLQMPAVYVYVAAERSKPNERAMGSILQRSEPDIGVVIVTENLSGVDDFEAAEDIENLKTYVRGKLIGFVPDGMDDPLEHVTGELQQAIAGTIWFEDVYTTARYLEEED